MATSNDEIYVKIITDVQSSLQNIGDYVAKIAAAYLSLRTLKDVIVDSFKSYQEMEDSVIKMNSALRITGQYSKESSSALEALSQQLRYTTVYGDETARSAEGILMQLSNLSVSGIQKIMPLIADFAASMGIDLVQAAELVGKTLGGTTNMLGRYGIQIKSGLDESDRFSAVVEQLTTKFGGMAEAISKSTSGQLAQLKNQIDELKESFGGLIANLLNPVLTNVNAKLGMRELLGFDIGSADLATLQSYGQLAEKVIKQNEQIATGLLLNKSPFINKGEAQNYINEAIAAGKILKEIQDRIATMPEKKLPFVNASATDELTQSIKALTDAEEANWEAYKKFLLAPTQTGMPTNPWEQDKSGTGTQWSGMSPEYLKQMADQANKLNVELTTTPQDLAAIAQQSAILAGQMQQVADAAVQFGTAIAKGDIAGAFATLGNEVLKLLVSYALTAAAAAAVKFDWATMAFWLAVAGAGVIGEIAIGASSGSSAPSSTVGSPTTSNRGGVTVNNYIAGSVISERSIARSVLASMSNY